MCTIRKTSSLNRQIYVVKLSLLTGQLLDEWPLFHNRTNYMLYCSIYFVLALKARSHECEITLAKHRIANKYPVATPARKIKIRIFSPLELTNGIVTFQCCGPAFWRKRQRRYNKRYMLNYRIPNRIFAFGSHKLITAL